MNQENIRFLREDYITAVILFRNQHSANIRDFKEDTKSFLYFCTAKKDRLAKADG